MEGDGTVLSFVVDSLLDARPGDDCAALRQQDQIAASTWQLVALHDASDTPMVIPPEPRATFAWDRTDGRFAGNAGCNRYAASGTLRGTTLAVGPAMGTKMACLSDESAALETRFLQVLGALPSVAVVSDTLAWAIGPREVARFVRQ
jgi:heat shock protein HslJ